MPCGATIAGCLFSFADLTNRYSSYYKKFIEPYKEDAEVQRERALLFKNSLNAQIEDANKAIEILKPHCEDEKISQVILGTEKYINETNDTLLEVDSIANDTFIIEGIMAMENSVKQLEKRETKLLIAGYVLVNLMSDYQYQHDIFFQYTFGSNAFLVYLTVVNLADLKINWQRIFALIAAVIVSAVCFGIVVAPKAMGYPVQAIQYYDYYQSIRDTLDTIPDGASVTATTFYTTHLSQRVVLYDVRYSSKEHLLETEYVVLNISSTSDYKKYATGGKENGFENLVKLLEKNGYTEYASLEDVVVIYRRVDSPS